MIEILWQKEGSVYSLHFPNFPKNFCINNIETIISKNLVEFDVEYTVSNCNEMEILCIPKKNYTKEFVVSFTNKNNQLDVILYYSEDPSKNLLSYINEYTIKLLSDVSKIMNQIINNKDLVIKPLLYKDCYPLLNGLSRLPQIKNIPEVPDLIESCPKIQPLTQYNNEKHTFNDNEVYSDWISRTRVFYNELNYEDRRALLLYTTAEYKKINTFIRTSSYIDDKDDSDDSEKDDSFYKIQDINDLKNVIRILKDVIYRAPRPSHILYAYRATDIAWTGKKDRIPSSFKPSHFSSFSMDYNVSIGFIKKKTDLLFRVEVGPSTPHVLNISSFNKLEAEILFDPDTEFNFANMESKVFSKVITNNIELNQMIPVYLLTIGRKLIRSHQEYLIQNHKKMKTAFK